MTLRTDDGDIVTVRANRFFSQYARTYNLTVEDLHSCTYWSATPQCWSTTAGA